MRPAKTQNRLGGLGIHPVSSESSLYVVWVAKDPRFLHADSEDSDQNGRMPRLIWLLLGTQVILLVLSWGGSNNSWSTVLLTVQERQIIISVMTAFQILKIRTTYNGCIWMMVKVLIVYSWQFTHAKHMACTIIWCSLAINGNFSIL